MMRAWKRLNLVDRANVGKRPLPLWSKKRIHEFLKLDPDNINAMLKCGETYL